MTNSTISRFSRRGFMGSMLAAGSAPLTLRQARAQAAQPVRVALATPLSGPIAIIGNDVKLGAELAVEWINSNGGAGGRRIELLVRDSKNNANDAVSVVRELVADGVKLITAGLSGFEALAQMPVIDEAGGLYIVNGTQAMAVTHEAFKRSMFRATDNDIEGTRALVQLAMDRYGDVTDWAVFTVDTQANLASALLFQRLLTEESKARGKTVNFIEPLLVKPGSGDGKVQLSKIMSSNTQGIYSQLVGSDGISIWTQARSFNLQSKVRAIVDKGSEVGFAKAMKRNVPNNFWTMTTWNHRLYDNVQSKALYDGYVARTGDKVPPGWLYNGASPMHIFAQAIAATGTIEPAKLIDALEGGLAINSPKGALRFRREDHQVLADVCAMKFDPADTEQGFEVADVARMEGAKLLEPAAPGVAFKA